MFVITFYAIQQLKYTNKLKLLKNCSLWQHCVIETVMRRQF